MITMKNINKGYMLGEERLPILKDINFQVNKGEYVAILGPSGSGKTTLMNMVGCMDVMDSGEYYLDGMAIHKTKEDDLTMVRNQKIGFIFQNYQLIPTYNVMQNIIMPLLMRGMTHEEAEEKCKNTIKLLGLDHRIGHKPNELSGGQKQRVSIARALVGQPAILLADEPTGALDQTSGKEVLKLFRELNDMGNTIVMITHDLGVVAQMCEKIAVMYAGHIVEYGTTDEIFYNPQHEYTKGLINSIPKLNAEEKERLVPIEGQPVDLLNPPAGCPFAPRCKSCMKICLSKMPPKTELSDTHYTHCWLRQKEEFEKGGKAE
mgnify:CR=1 FL=1